MDENAYKIKLLQQIQRMIVDKHESIDGASIVTLEIKNNAMGYIQALYQVEHLILSQDI